jgi:hypothetical protein
MKDYYLIILGVGIDLLIWVGVVLEIVQVAQ